MDQATGEVHCAARSAERTGSVKIELPVAAGAVACRKTRASRAAACADAGPALEASDVREPGGTGRVARLGLGVLPALLFDARPVVAVGVRRASQARGPLRQGAAAGTQDAGDRG